MRALLKTRMAFAAFGALLALPLAASDGAVSGGLSFADRVACQTALEEVYWRHRIWPRENPGPKPALAEVMPQAAIVRKVEDGLAMSTALDEHYRTPIEPAHLQAELDRMARGSSHPGRLAELFAALGNDATLAAECLARPALAERRLRAAYALDRERTERSFDAWWEQERPVAASLALAPAVASYKLPALASVPGCDGAWSPTSPVSAPQRREQHTAIWTGSEMIVWGGASVCDNMSCVLNSGGRYDPATDTWSATSTLSAPGARALHTVVWTGTRMIVWGGSGDGSEGNQGYLNSGGLYNPATNSWSATSLAGAPGPRIHHTAVWTGTRMIVWGGWTIMTDSLNDGGLYDPATGSWAATSLASAPEARFRHTAVWTGSRMVIGGGEKTGAPPVSMNSGGLYDPATGTWTAMSTPSAPAFWGAYQAVWTGTEMIVWAGSGSRYNPATNTWTGMSQGSAPDPRGQHMMVWTGSEMIVWGGLNGEDGYQNSGGRYNPATDSWAAMSTVSAPAPRSFHSMIWMGTEMIVWGGVGDLLYGDGGRFCPSGLNWIAFGDSYSSGEGAGEPFYLAGTDTEQNKCHRSNTAYSRTFLDLPRTADAFLACSGARTWNVLPAAKGGRAKCFQQEGSNTCSPYAPPDDVPQLDHPEVAEADLITLTIGGNDARFNDVLKWCYEEDDCKSFTPEGYGMTLGDYLPRLIASTRVRVQLTLEAMREKAPQADIRVLGYPALFPIKTESQSCGILSDPPGPGKWEPAEQTWLNDLVPLLNNALQQAAESTGARFVRVAGLFSGHEVCGPEGPWFVPPPQGWWPKVGPEIFHPTILGQTEGYRRALEADLEAVPFGSLHARLAPARGHETETATASLPTLEDLPFKVVAPACDGVAVPGQEVSISGEDFAAGTTITILLDAPNRQVLKTLTTDGAGRFATTVTLPVGIPPQVMARLEAAGTGANLQPRLLVAHITLGPDLAVDQDHDGIPDACDNCLVASNPAQADADRDGAGDTCDICPSDPLNDIDGDGLCANVDSCPSDPFNDGDGDGLCAERDNCPLAANPGQSDADGDGWGDACDACPGEPGAQCAFNFFTVTPCRLADTRAAEAPSLSSSSKRLLQVTGRCGIPATAKAVSVNLTVTGATGGGHVQAWPADLPPPGTSAVNFAAGQTRANNAILSLAKDGVGDVAVRAVVLGGGTVHLILDVNGYFE